MGVALEVEHGIDDMLEDARTGNRALLGHVPDQDHGNRALLGEPCELRRAFAHLCDAAWRRFERLRVDGLDRVDHHDLGLTAADCRDDCLELHFRQQLDRSVDQTQAPGTHRNLLGRLLSGHVERALAGADRRHRLQQERRLANAGISAERRGESCEYQGAQLCA